MPYTTVVAGTTITASWANANVRDQVVSVFADASARSSAIASPAEGMVSYRQDTNRTDFYNGAAWQPINGAAAKVVRGTDMTITSGVQTSVVWSTASYDSHSMFAGGQPTRLSAPWTGFYTISTTISWNSSSGGNSRRVGIYKNGTVEDQQGHQMDGTGDTTSLRQNCVSAGLQMTAGDYVEVQIFQNSGSDRTVDAAISNFKMAYEGPA